MATLPRPATTLIGRDAEIDAICALVQGGVRLLTLTGPGGIGKTRLAQAAAERLAGSFPDGIVYVPLAPLTDPGLLPVVIADAFALRSAGRRSLLDALIELLAGRSLLLVLDNLEHLLSATPMLVELLAGASHLFILDTSRARLRLSGEHLFIVPALTLPTPAQEADPALASQAEAVRLFVARAGAVTPDFLLTAANATDVVQLCRHLDGLPLAIELAAARVTALPPATLRTQLERGRPVLTGGPRDQPARLQTMRDAIAWSHALLSPAEQVAFRRLAVFAGGWTLTAAETVTGIPDLLEITESLIEKSLLQPAGQDPDGDPRFAMLETIRVFGYEQLVAHEEAKETGRRHAAFFLSLAEEAEQNLLNRWMAGWMDRLEADRDNIRAALRQAIDDEDAAIALRLVAALFPFWFFRAKFIEARSWTERALALPGEAPPAVRARALHPATLYARIGGDFVAARRWVAEGLPLAAACGERQAEAKLQWEHAVIAGDQGEHALARDRLALALSSFLAIDEPFWVANTLSILGYFDATTGDLAAASAHVDEALARFRVLGHPWGLAATLQAAGQLADMRGDRARAEEVWREALELHWRGGYPWMVMWGLTDMAAAMVEAAPERAARLLGAADALGRRIGSSLDRIHRERREATMGRARAALGEQAFRAALAAGQEMPLDDAVASALGVPQQELVAPAARSPHGLSPRELEILHLVVEGKSNQQIADQLFLSLRTVTTHVSHILTKLGVESRTAAAAFAIHAGLA